MIQHTNKWDGKSERRQKMLTEIDVKLIVQAIQGQDKKFFGLKVNELIMVGVFVLGLTGFYFRTNDVIARLVVSNEYLVQFSQNSDAYHSAALGTTFKQGQPLNPNYDLKRIRNIINGTTQ